MLNSSYVLAAPLHRKRRVVILDHDETRLSIFREVLTVRGFSVRGVTSVADLETARPEDLLIVHYPTPGVDLQETLSNWPTETLLLAPNMDAVSMSLSATCRLFHKRSMMEIVEAVRLAVIHKRGPRPGFKKTVATVAAGAAERKLA